ncbi:MAG: molybdopterin molybdotransferase [Candidatus Binatota bacterium]|jgi:molybdopterin molybdotransferase|nr:molybdopterin molybdotransferase [Candidatus Binatota bacterium]
MISVREALDVVVREVSPLGAERVGIVAAGGRALAEEVRSGRDVPGTANSAMDGYAVRHADLTDLPARLRVVGIAAAGAVGGRVNAGEALKIMTGAPIPAGADTVVRVEDTRADGDLVEIGVAPAAGANVRGAGEDVRSGDAILSRGRRVGPAEVGLLASIGRAFVLVVQRPRVAILSTGNELVEADDTVSPGQVVNSNAYTLAAAVAEAGALPVILPIARDSLAETRAAFREAARHDAILSTGGVSVGDFDYVKAAMDEVGVRRLFWKVAQKPGKPLTFGMLEGRPYFGLPGNPVSSLVCFELYARPALRKMAGFEAIHLPTAAVTLGEDVKKAPGLTEFIRCRIERRDGRLVATSTGSQSSGVLRSMSQGHALVIGAAEVSRLRAGSGARAILLDPQAGATEPPF